MDFKDYLRYFLSCLIYGIIVAKNKYIFAAAIFTLLNSTVYADEVAVNTNSPALIIADEMLYDSKEKIATANGKVEIYQDSRTMLSDSAIYNVNADKVIAEGNITIIQPNKDLIFADKAILTDRMKNGTIQNPKAKLADNSRMVANYGERINGNIFKLHDVAYTPCKCVNGRFSPLWKVRAKEAKMDNEKEVVTYRNAYFDLFNKPLFYTPYFSNPTSNARSKSGFLIPSYKSISSIGQTVKIPYYVTLAPNMDASFSPIFTTKVGTIFSGDFRHKLTNGSYSLEGSFTQPSGANIPGTPADRDFRGHLKAHGKFSGDNNWEYGFNVNRASDDTYMQRYKFGTDNFLTSRIYAENLTEKQQFTIQGLAFQNLYSGELPETAPVIFPNISNKIKYDTGFYNSIFIIESDAAIISRDVGIKSRRITQKASYDVPYAYNGHLFNFITSARGDLYSIDNFETQNGTLYEGVNGRFIPEAEARWRYPLINPQFSKLTIEPQLSFITSPNGGNPNKIPNQDSQEAELSDANLFASNRFSGFDRIETGTRVNYGIRTDIQEFMGGNHLNTLFGQVYRFKSEENLKQNNIDAEFSDFVGRISYDYNSALSFNYRFALDQEDLSVKRSEIGSWIRKYPFSLNINYVGLDDVNDIGILTPANIDKKQLYVNGSYDITKEWSVNGNIRRGLSGDGEMISNGAGIGYSMDCAKFLLGYNHQFVTDRDITPDSTVMFQILLKNMSY